MEKKEKDKFKTKLLKIAERKNNKLYVELNNIIDIIDKL